MNSFDERHPRWFTAWERISAIMFASLLFWVGLFGVITIPACVAGVFGAVTPMVRPSLDSSPVRNFWRAFKSTFGRSLILGLLDLLIFAAIFMDIRIFLSWQSTAGRVVAYAFGLIGVAVALVNVYAWPLLAWYQQPLKRVLRNAWLLTVAHPVAGLGSLVAATMVIYVVVVLPGPLTAVWALFGPGLVGVLVGVAVWRTLKRYPLPASE